MCIPHNPNLRLSRKSRQMAIFRRPVSTRRKASRPSGYKAKAPMRTTRTVRSSAYKPIDTVKGTNPQSVLVHRGIGIPETFRTRLIWNQMVSLTPPASGNASYAVRMNGVFDPQYNLGGSQPNYWDQLANLYGRYNVKGAKITCTFSLPTQTTSDGPYIVGINGSRNPVSSSVTGSILTGAPNTGYKILSQGGNPVLVTATYSPKLLTDGQDSDAVGAPINATPVREWLSNVFVTNNTTQATPNVVICMITVEYLVDFFEMFNIIDS